MTKRAEKKVSLQSSTKDQKLKQIPRRYQRKEDYINEKMW
jgi:hypothetical protein